MSIASEIMDAASEIAGEDVSSDYGNTIVSAIDALADACAGEDVEAGSTIAEAIKKLAPYISTGGGGGGGGGEGAEIGGMAEYCTNNSDGDSEPLIWTFTTSSGGIVTATSSAIANVSCVGNVHVKAEYAGQYPSSNITVHHYDNDGSVLEDIPVESVTYDDQTHMTVIEFEAPEIPYMNPTWNKHYVEIEFS